MLLFWVNLVWLLQLGLCFIIYSIWCLLVDKESEYEASLVVFTVCLLYGFSNGVSGGMMVVWLCVVSRTCLLFFRTYCSSEVSSFLSPLYLSVLKESFSRPLNKFVPVVRPIRSSLGGFWGSSIRRLGF